MARPIEVAKRKSAIVSSTKIKQQQQLATLDGSNVQDETFDQSQESEIDSDDRKRPGKRARASSGKRINASISYHDLVTAGETSKAACLPPLRKHNLAYHRPLLLDAEQGRTFRDSLLKWYDGVSLNRSMPWRKAWIDPSRIEDKIELREALKKRAYEVWISEIMLQQTRVSTVISYWTSWIEKWPTIESLARAEPEEVLSAWRGLGYYSRATRIHTAAKKVVEDAKMQGLLPESAEALQKHVPGVGRYTGGAIASIVFGNAAPMVDGNVLRVLSRQLGIYGDVKSSKKIIDLLWDIADNLVKQIAIDASSDGVSVDGKSEKPGIWGQALMELGSTICTPHPSCRSCPISASCKVYAEGKLLAESNEVKVKVKAATQDIEDLCTVCQDFGEVEVDDEATSKVVINTTKTPAAKKSNGKQATLSAFAFTGKASSPKASTATKLNGIGTSNEGIEIIESHARKFPMKVSKKAVREEEAVVCVIRDHNGQYLLHQRPEKGKGLDVSLSNLHLLC